MTTATLSPEALVRLAHLTRVEYERRILLQADRRRLDGIPTDEQDEYDVWAHRSLTLLHVHAWEQLTAARREFRMEA